MIAVSGEVEAASSEGEEDERVPDARLRKLGSAGWEWRSVTISLFRLDSSTDTGVRAMSILLAGY